MSCQNKEIQFKITTNISFSARPETISLKNNIHPLAFRGPVFNAGVFQNVIKSEKKLFKKKSGREGEKWLKSISLCIFHVFHQEIVEISHLEKSPAFRGPGTCTSLSPIFTVCRSIDLSSNSFLCEKWTFFLCISIYRDFLYISVSSQYHTLR